MCGTVCVCGGGAAPPLGYVWSYTSDIIISIACFPGLYVYIPMAKHTAARCRQTFETCLMGLSDSSITPEGSLKEDSRNGLSS